MGGANTFGRCLQLTSFGESHGAGLGAVIDGCPAGVTWDEKLLEAELARRRPGSSAVVSARNESDQPEVLSGVFQGKTLGTPIAVLVRNGDQRSQDYNEIAQAPRPGHADDVWRLKFGHSDHRGGGRSSGRETLARVIGGSVARMFLLQSCPGFRVIGYARQIGPYELSEEEIKQVSESTELYPSDTYTARFPSKLNQKKVEQLLSSAKSEGRSYGGVAELRILGVPAGLGQPVFHKLKSDLAAAMISVGATSSFELGEGYEAAAAEGSEFHRRENDDRYGGIRGGISTGEPIVLRIGFKPTATVLDTAKQGRHDPCIVPRAIPVLEAMALLTLADHLLWARGDRI